MLQFLIKPLLGVAGDMIKGVVATKKAKSEAKLTEIKAATALKEQQIAGIESYNLFMQSKEYPIKWESVLQWAQRSVGNPWFSNSTIHTAPDGSFSGITIRPDSFYSLEEQGHAYYVPINDPATEIVGTTWSSWPQFTADKSGFTQSYTGYTDYSLSGTETTQMFDLYFNYSAFTGTTLIPLSNKSPSIFLLPPSIKFK